MHHRRSGLGIAAFLALGSLYFPCAADAGLVDVNVFTTKVYRQTSAAPPVSPIAYYMSLGGRSQNAGDFPTASASYPGNDFLPLTVNGTSFGYTSTTFPTLTSLHATFPLGAYTVTGYDSHFGTPFSGHMNRTVDLFTNDIPAFTSATYNAVQHVNPAIPLTLAFTPHATIQPEINQPLVYISLFDASTFTTILSAGPFAASTASFVVPANTFLPNKSYLADLIFSDRIQAVDPIGHVTTYQSWDTRTQIAVATGTVPEPAGAGLLGLIFGYTMMLDRKKIRRLRVK